jgi:protein-tyrosine phosphatase
MKDVDMISQTAVCLDDHVDGAVNLRDLGGYRAGAGYIRPGLLFRSGMTHHITPRGLRALVERYGMRTAIDLRSDMELKDDGIAPFGDVGITHHHVPVFTSVDATAEMQQQRMAEMRSGNYDWAALYQQMTTNGAPAFARLFEVISEPDRLPAVFHCSGGRDRTGVSAALVLSILGVHDDDIAHDYAATGTYLQPHLALFSRFSMRMELAPSEMARVMETSAEAMHGFLAGLRASHGSTEGYLHSIGVTDEQIQRVRGLLLDPGAKPSARQKPSSIRP